VNLNWIAKGLAGIGARLRMAEVPVGAELIETSVSAAPSFRPGKSRLTPFSG
jgi:hypothetical protein